ncbi:MAG: thermonuclease family protein [Blastomonas sp.]
MAKIDPISSRRTQQNQALIIILSVLLAALAGWNLNAWLMPMPQDVVALQMLDHAETPDPWATSREQRRLLEVQEDAPAPVAELTRTPHVGAEPDAVSARFGICGGGARVTCVVDGDTIWLRGQKIRIADIDTPEISSPRCPAELQRGRLATRRLVELLNTGPFMLEPADRAQDRYGRALYRLTRGGTSLGDTLVGEGLAVWYGNGRPDWC